MYYSLDHSALYFRVVKIHHKSDVYVKAKMEFFCKTSNLPCTWLPLRNYKINRIIFDSYKPYEIKHLQ